MSLTTTHAGSGLSIARRHTTLGEHPFNTIDWELRDARIGRGDKVAFEQNGVEFPAAWSLNATNIVAHKYFRGQLGSPTREHSVKQLIGRVARTIADWGRARAYFTTDDDADAFEAELIFLLVQQMAAFDSPVWLNVGVDEDQPQCSSSSILSVEDTIESILDWQAAEAKILRRGSGSGINLSAIRGSGEPSNGGTATGPVAFMRNANAWAGILKASRPSRWAGRMVVLDADHPDIREFIWSKAIEEENAASLRAAGFDVSGEGNGLLSLQHENANHAVRVTDEFMRAVENDADWRLIARTTGEPVGDSIPARELMRDIADAAWRCADPGVQYDTTINQWHTSPNSGRINASGPGSEFVFLDNSASHVASINLMKFRRPEGSFDIDSFGHTVDIVLLAQDIIVGHSSYPDRAIEQTTVRCRPVALGYANLGAYLMSNGMPYDSDPGRGTAAAITALMTGRAYAQSARIAEALGPYERYENNREAHNHVTRMHRDASYAIPDSTLADTPLLEAARVSCEQALDLGDQHGYRNAQVTTLAPTGTISFLMDCDTTGIEPDFSLVKFKELVGGGMMTVANRTVPMALQTLGYADEQIEQIETYVNEHATILGAPELADEHLPVFDVAVGERAISHMGHIKMMGAVQPFLSGAISKTVNMPQTATVEDIADAYIQAWKCGVKTLAVYRNGSKTMQAPRADAKEIESTGNAAGAAIADLLTRSPLPEIPSDVVASAAQRALSSALFRLYWEGEVGRLLTGAQAQRAAHWGDRELAERVAHEDVLVLRDPDGDELFPDFQFAEPQVAVVVAETLAILRPVTASPATIATWWVTPNDYLDERTPSACALTGSQHDVREAARRLAARLGA
ncbi:MAG: ribonucleoside-diphosphate reductase alpha chain [Solirubrobacteraceae bacterium]